MKRRDALIGAAVAGLSARAALAQQGGPDRFGSIVQPPSKEMNTEKHVPIIDAPPQVNAGEPFTVNVQVGKVVPHPNTVEHHIKWIELYVIEDGSDYAKELGRYNFFAVYSNPNITAEIVLQKNSTLYALEHCNIHGLWDYSMKIRVV